ncbi:translocation/assembly module TamB domain-containing protein [Microbulbifer yueqingensis]|uniref:Translocation and assembly module TamB C-terminal domain-containing protein n=1 Tax=Microbulbifer yueqingensis TaxID=658219 RepID=A0A1G8UNP3_9GAMM|nr:translocation/assembly module TamB [Microbulbifer yueqingensis]SDJ55462.1 Family of unknown function [Microbulbifer yueqingensis]
MKRSLSALASGYVRALGSVLRSLWHSLSGRGAMISGILLMLLLALLYFAGTGSGRVSLTRGAFLVAERMVPELAIQSGRMASEHLGHWSFSSLKVDYRGKVLLQGRDLAVGIDLGALISGQLDIERIRAAELLLDMDVLQSLLEERTERVEAEVEDRPMSVPAIRLGQLDIGRLRIIDSRYPDLPVVALDSDGRFRWQDEPTRLSFELRELNGAGLEASLQAKEIREGVFRLEFLAREDSGGFVGRLLQLPAGQALDARGLITVRESGDRLALDIEEFSLPLVAHRFSLVGPAEIALSPWQVGSEGLALAVDGTSHHISGSVSGDRVDAEVRLDRLPLAITQPWQDYLQGGWLTADLSVRGPLSLPNVSGMVELRSSFRHQPVHLQGRVATRDEVIQLEGATLEYADARLDLDGAIDVGAETIDLQGELARLEMDDIRGLLAALPEDSQVELPPELSGSVDGLVVSANGPWGNPDFTARIRARPVYRNLETSLQATASGNLKEIRLRELSLQGDRFAIRGGGRVSLEKQTLALELSATADQFPPRLLLDAPELEGIAISLESDLRVSGPWDKPRLDASVESDGKYRQYRYRLSGGIAGNLDRLLLDGVRLELSSMDPGRGFDAPALRGRQSPLADMEGQEPDAPRQTPSRLHQLAREAEQLAGAGSAWLELDGVVEPRRKRARGTVAGRNIPVSLAQLAGISLPPSLEGEVSLDGEFSGPFASPQARADILASGEFQEKPWHLRGEIGYRQGSISLTGVDLLWAGRNRLVAEGTLNEKQLDLDLTANAVLADLELGLPAELNERGEISLQATATGSPRNPQLQGELVLDSVAAGSRGAIEPLRASLNWRTEGRLLLVEMVADHGSRRAAQASARLAVAEMLEALLSPDTPAPPVPLELDSEGSADLAVVGAFLDPGIHAMRGQLRFTVNADGTLDRPELRGELSLENGSYEHRPSNTRLRNIDILARLTPDRWVLERARAEDREDGSINIGGEVTFPEAGPPRLAFEGRARRLHLLNSPAVRGAVSGTLALTGTTEASRLEGRLVLRPLEVQVEQLFGSSIPEIEVVEVEEEVGLGDITGGPPILENIALAVQVVLDQQSYVRGLGLNSELQGQVNVRGTAAEPDASGELTIVRGNFDLLGKRFELLEGRVLFENSEAAIYVKGRHEYSEGEIIAEISGTTDDLDIEFSSTPAAAQDEIFAQLLFGKSLTDISPLQAVRLVTVVRTLQGNGAGFDPLAKTRELLGVDTFDIKSEEGEEGQDRYALSLGKYITSRIFIELQRSTDPLNPWQAEMQIELRKNLNLELKSAGSNESGAGSVELQWKRDY